MDTFNAVINVYAAGMAEVLGWSYEQVLDRCTIRELLLYSGTLAQRPTPEGQVPVQEKPLEEQIKDWENHFDD